MPLCSEAEEAVLFHNKQAARLGVWLRLFSATAEALQHLINSTPNLNTRKHGVPNAEACLACALLLPSKGCTVVHTCVPKGLSTEDLTLPQELYPEVASSSPILTRGISLTAALPAVASTPAKALRVGRGL